MSSNFTFGFNRMVPPSAAASWATAPAISRAPATAFRAPATAFRAPATAFRAPAPVSSTPATAFRAPVSVSGANAPVTRSNRFSMTRMINFKSSGGCRSCN